MRTYVTRNNLWICELRVAGVLCICESNNRRMARRGAISMARRRTQVAA